MTDTKFNKPKAHLLFLMALPEAYTTPKNFILTSMFVNLANDSLNEQFTYNAEVAGLR
jgi:secreted Zn-dependent insulinase-like peptidase